MVPLGEGFSVADVIRKLRCEVAVVARNKLGTINHTRLTVEAVNELRPQKVTVVLMNLGIRDASTGTNSEILSELLAPVSVVEFPFIGKNSASLSAILRKRRIWKKCLRGCCSEVLSASFF